MPNHPLLGLFYSLVTALMWGTLPVAFTLLHGGPDPLTVTWIRFLFSSIVVFALLWHRHQLPAVREWRWREWMILIMATLLLASNFVLYLLALNFISPEATVVLIQVAPFILMFGSIYFYGERLSKLDWCGVALLFIGLPIFFNDKLALLMQTFTGESLGIIYILLAALSWGFYGLLQKNLLRKIGSIQLTLLIYAGGALALSVVSKPATLLQMNTPQFIAVLFGCLNMVIGYGAFTEALRVWQGAKVSTIIALAPVITIVSMKLAVLLWPTHFTNSGLNAGAYFGAILVVLGSMLSALGKQKAGKNPKK